MVRSAIYLNLVPNWFLHASYRTVAIYWFGTFCSSNGRISVDLVFVLILTYLNIIKLALFDLFIVI